MSGASQMCPACRSPLRPCKCDRDEYLAPPGAKANSTLGVRKGKALSSKTRLRSRTLEEKHGDDPVRYGPLWKILRPKKCFGLAWVPGHRCGPGYAPPTAHHLGETDLDGLLPTCGKLHDRLEEFPNEIELISDWTLERIGRLYVVHAARCLDGRDEMVPEIEEALARGGIEWAA